MDVGESLLPPKDNRIARFRVCECELTNSKKRLVRINALNDTDP